MAVFYSGRQFAGIQENRQMHLADNEQIFAFVSAKCSLLVVFRISEQFCRELVLPESRCWNPRIIHFLQPGFFYGTACSHKHKQSDFKFHRHRKKDQDIAVIHKPQSETYCVCRPRRIGYRTGLHGDISGVSLSARLDIPAAHHRFHPESIRQTSYFFRIGGGQFKPDHLIRFGCIDLRRVLGDVELLQHA